MTIEFEHIISIAAGYKLQASENASSVDFTHAYLDIKSKTKPRYPDDPRIALCLELFRATHLSTSGDGWALLRETGEQCLIVDQAIVSDCALLWFADNIFGTEKVNLLHTDGFVADSMQICGSRCIAALCERHNDVEWRVAHRPLIQSCLAAIEGDWRSGHKMLRQKLAACLVPDSSRFRD